MACLPHAIFVPARHVSTPRFGYTPGPMAERVLPNGVRLHWREAGDPSAPSIVWIHGGSIEDSSMMVSDLEPFSSAWRVLLPDTRGHGLFSEFARPEDYTYPRKGEDVLLWLDALG